MSTARCVSMNVIDILGRRLRLGPIFFASALAVAAITASEPALANEPAPGPTAPVPIRPTCSLGDHAGVEDADARTGAEIVCDELARVDATATEHEVRFGKLGGKIVVTVASHDGTRSAQRRTLLVALDELPVAAPRIARALADDQSLENTKNVDNVLSGETRSPKVERSQAAFDLGFFALSGARAGTGIAGGFQLGAAFRAGNFAVTSHGRAGGIGSSRDKMTTASLDVGARYYLSNGATAAFVGGGAGLAYFSWTPIRDGSGVVTFAEVGLDIFRTHHASFNTSLRVDVPLFALEETYVVPLSLNIGVAFR